LKQIPKQVQMDGGFLQGTLQVPPSKSLAHRAVIGAALAPGESLVENVAFSVDIQVTVAAMEALGAVIEREPDGSGRFRLRIRGIGERRSAPVTLDCAESGSTLRFLIPLALQFAPEVTFTGRGRLVKRPLDIYYRIFDGQNIPWENTDGQLPLTVRKGLSPGVFSMAGDVSSQFLTGLLYTLPLLSGDSEIRVTTPLESRGYVDLTLDSLKKSGIRVEHEEYRRFRVPGNQTFRPVRLRVEGDFSQGAFLLVAGATGGDLILRDLRPDSLQGDRVILSILAENGADLSRLPDGSFRIRKKRIRAFEAECSEFPDLVPVLGVLAATALGTSRLTGLERLKIKESDRLSAIYAELGKLGAIVRRGEDWLEVTGQESLPGGVRVDAWGDHRIAMSMAVAALSCENPLELTGADSVSKSWPDFWEDYGKLGGAYHERNLG